MSCKDRTSEFTAVAESLQSRNPQFARSKGVSRGQKSQFTEIASQIGKDIQLTTARLQKLTQLAQKKSLFDDPAAEIHELTVRIKQDITSLSNQITSLQQHIKDKYASLSNKQSEAHSQTVLEALKANLNATTKDFKDVVQLRTENLKSQQIRRQQFSFASPPISRTGSGTSLNRTASSLSMTTPLLDGQRNTNERKDVVLDMGSSSMGRSQSQALLSQDQYYDHRTRAVESVESTIVELGGIFQQLATMVSEQADLVERIDSNVDDMSTNVEQAQNQLLKYLNNISSNRW
eukprot:CAMPEP_0184659600 /NCGR_PEP_ID=MMETSP0308-20130426/30319_1 /TAXON_ID=38269 /ORGANISM="Gloeochaete witrockiana, Strain SAG 46.84" /LENGTH=290 /DNA_ID=CAMNT_0027099547 /DNA_START=186 /DNA_END=1055 /DNA_ORIENTATION=+